MSQTSGHLFTCNPYEMNHKNLPGKTAGRYTHVRLTLAARTIYEKELFQIASLASGVHRLGVSFRVVFMQVNE